MILWIDTETGGFSWRQDGLLQVAAITTSGFESGLVELDRMEVKIRKEPGRRYCREALELNHYDDDLWQREGLDLDHALRKVLAFAWSACRWEDDLATYFVAGHNVKFDLNFLRGNGLYLPIWRTYDTMKASSKPKISLDDLCRSLDVEFGGAGAHDALSDIAATVECARRLNGVVSGGGYEMEDL
jgi:DNA polymerase III epsilon subunit-like protein